MESLFGWLDLEELFTTHEILIIFLHTLTILIVFIRLSTFWEHLFLHWCVTILLYTEIHFSVNKKHCVKSVQIRSFFWSVVFRIRTEYGEIRSISLYSVRMRKYTDQKKLRIWTHLFILVGEFFSFQTSVTCKDLIEFKLLLQKWYNPFHKFFWKFLWYLVSIWES